MTEYALILVVVAIAAILILTVMGTTLSQIYSNVVCSVRAQSCTPVAAAWNPTGSLTISREVYAATLLPSGKVLITGGYSSASSSVVASAEIYNPALGTFSPTGSMGTARYFHAATLLANGKVLITGGSSNGSQEPPLASAEIFDPAGNGGVGSFSPTGSMSTGRLYHTATLLPSGKVLIAGGDNFPVASAEIFDPAGNGGIGSFSPTGSMATARYAHSATLLPNGKVLIAGGASNGYGMAASEIFDPAGNGGVGSFSPTGSMAHERSWFFATLLPGGKVLVAGGFGNVPTYSPRAEAELFDPAGNGGIGSWSATGSMTAERAAFGGTLLSGQVLVAGGYSNGFLTTASAEIYNPTLGTWSATASMATVRHDYALVSLPSGKALAAGGVNDSGPLSLAEIYTP